MPSRLPDIETTLAGMAKPLLILLYLIALQPNFLRTPTHFHAKPPSHKARTLDSCRWKAPTPKTARKAAKPPSHKEIQTGLLFAPLGLCVLLCLSRSVTYPHLPIHVPWGGCVNPGVRRVGLLAVTLAVAAFAADPALTRTLAAVEARYNSAATLQVLFHEDYTPPGRPHRSESGTLTLSRPGRMRWEYSQPPGKLWVSDGKTVSMYLPQENRVERAPLKESGDARVPLAFLLGKLHFEKEFRNIQGRPEGTGMRILAEPKSDSLPYSQVEFLLTAQNQIREVKLTGFDKSLLVYSFNEEKMNPPADARLFRLAVPAGAEVVESEQ